MLDARHSPGPWWAERREICFRAADGQLRFFAETYSGPCASLEEADANDALIAAAPTLHQALHELAEAVHSQEPAAIAHAMRGASEALRLVSNPAPLPLTMGGIVHG